MGTQDNNSKKTAYIQRKLKEGISRELIAHYLGYKNWRCLDIYMRRRGFRWNSKKQCYGKLHEWNNEPMSLDLKDAPSKVASILLAYSKKDADPRAIARKSGFASNRQLALYMASRGYTWSFDDWNYYKSDTRVQLPAVSTAKPNKRIGGKTVYYHPDVETKEDYDRSESPMNARHNAGVKELFEEGVRGDTFIGADGKDISAIVSFLHYLMAHKNKLAGLLEHESGIMVSGDSPPSNIARQTNFTLTGTLLDQVNALCRKKGMTYTQVIEKAIEKLVMENDLDM